MHFTGSTLVANNRVETPSNAEQVPPFFSIPDSSETLEITSKCFALDLLVMPHSCVAVIWFVSDCRCWNGYSRKVSLSQGRVAAEWIPPCLVNTSCDERSKADAP